MKITVKNLLNSTVIFAVGNIISKAIGLISIPVVVSYVAVHEYGIAGMILGLGVLLVPLFGLGTSAAVGASYFSKNTPSEREQVLCTAYFFLIIMSALLFSVGFFLSEYINNLLFTSGNYALEVKIGIVGFGLMLLSQTLLLRAQFLNRPDIYSTHLVLNSSVCFLTSFYCVAFLEKGALGVLIGVAAGQAAAAVFLHLRFLKFIFCLRQFKVHILSEICTSGLKLLPGFCFLFVIQGGVRFPVERFGSLDELGHLNLALAIGGALGVLTAAMLSAWFPYSLSLKDDWENRKTEVSKIFLVYVICGCASVVLIQLLLYPIAFYIFSPSYLPSIKIVGMITLSTFMISVASFMQLPLYLADRYNMVVTAQGRGAFVCVLTYGIIYVSPLIGASFSLIISGYFLLYFQQRLNKKVAAKFTFPINLILAFRIFGLTTLVASLSAFGVFERLGLVWVFILMAISVLYFLLEACLNFKSVRGLFIMMLPK